MANWNYFFMASDMYARIPMKVKTVLPDEGFPLRVLQVHGNGMKLPVYCKPKNPLGPVNTWGHRRRIVTHRLIALCPCGRHVPFGRLGQHIKACEELRALRCEHDHPYIPSND